MPKNTLKALHLTFWHYMVHWFIKADSPPCVCVCKPLLRAVPALWRFGSDAERRKIPPILAHFTRFLGQMRRVKSANIRQVYGGLKSLQPVLLHLLKNYMGGGYIFKEKNRESLQ